jgi:hypothetical protein
MLLILFSFLIGIGLVGSLVYKLNKPRRWIAFVHVFLLVVALSIVYIRYIAVWYGYQGFLLSLSLERALLAILLLILMMFFMPISVNRPSDLLVQVWCLIGYIPILLLFMLGDANINYLIFVSCCFGIIIYFQRKGFILKIPKLKQGILGYLLLILIFLYTYSVLISSFGFTFNMSILDVYDIRSDYVRVAAAYPFLSYLAIWQGYVINPVLFSVFLKQRKYVLSAFMLFLIFLLFSITGLKNLLTGVFFVLLILFIIKPQNSFSLLASSLSILVVGSGVITEISGRLEFVSVAVRRLFFLPALLNFRFYEFFSVNPKTKFGYSLFSYFVDYPYDLPPSGIIASYIDPTKNSGANAGFLADAYANFGFIGMIVFTFLLIFILRITDSLSEGKDWRLVSIALIMPFFALINSALLTTLLSHGLLFALLLYWMLQDPSLSKNNYLRRIKFIFPSP